MAIDRSGFRIFRGDARLVFYPSYATVSLVSGFKGVLVYRGQWSSHHFARPFSVCEEKTNKGKIQGQLVETEGYAARKERQWPEKGRGKGKAKIQRNKAGASAAERERF